MSPAFKWRGSHPPLARPDIERALAVLLEELSHRGWISDPAAPEPPGAEWFERVLVRRRPEARVAAQEGARR